MTRGQKKRLEKRQRIFNLLEDILMGTLLFIGVTVVTVLMMAMY